MRSKASSFKWEYPLLSLRSSSSFLRLLPRLLVTSLSPFIFPSITRFRRQFLRKMWPIQLAFRFRISLGYNQNKIQERASGWFYYKTALRIFSSLKLSNVGYDSSLYVSHTLEPEPNLDSVISTQKPATVEVPTGSASFLIYCFNHYKLNNVDLKRLFILRCVI